MSKKNPGPMLASTLLVTEADQTQASQNEEQEAIAEPNAVEAHRIIMSHVIESGHFPANARGCPGE